MITFINWIIEVEKMDIFDYTDMPEYRKNKIRANYQEYCEMYQVAPAY